MHREQSCEVSYNERFWLLFLSVGAADERAERRAVGVADDSTRIFDDSAAEWRAESATGRHDDQTTVSHRIVAESHFKLRTAAATSRQVSIVSVPEWGLQLWDEIKYKVQNSSSLK